eukprot:scaffold24583_cov72-Skeletonema_marinoi.AAC.1
MTSLSSERHNQAPSGSHQLESATDVSSDGAIKQTDGRQGICKYKDSRNAFHPRLFKFSHPPDPGLLWSLLPSHGGVTSNRGINSEWLTAIRPSSVPVTDCKNTALMIISKWREKSGSTSPIGNYRD